MIPLGTHMTVPGYGEAVAADTGSAIKGAIIDLWFPTRRAGASVGPAVGHDHARLDFRRCSLRQRRHSTHGSIPARTARRQGGKAEQGRRRHRSSRRECSSSTTTTSSARGLRTLLEGQGVDVCGEAETGTEALNLIRETVPDVVVMDLNMPGIGGVEATRQITMIAPSTRVLVLTISDQDADVIDAILAGACGYLLKDAAINELMAGIRAAVDGRVARLPRDRVEAAAARARHAHRRRATPRRSARSSPTARSRC